MVVELVAHRPPSSTGQSHPVEVAPDRPMVLGLAACPVWVSVGGPNRGVPLGLKNSDQKPFSVISDPTRGTDRQVNQVLTPPPVVSFARVTCGLESMLRPNQVDRVHNRENSDRTQDQLTIPER